ncbi:MAG: hypothetical protein AAGI30_03650 [Planctomycetota bacterium]
MQTILALAFWLVAGVVCLYVAHRYFSRKSELFTGLHLFLAGMVFFQLINSAPVMHRPYGEEYTVQHPVEAGSIFLVWNILFLIFLMLGYHKSFGATVLADRVRMPSKVPTDTLLLLCTPLLIAMAYALRAVNINYVAALTSMVGLALASAAAGIAGWTIARNYLNPVYYIVGAPIMAAAAYISGIGEFSRRPILSVVIAIGWGMYYGRFRELKPLTAAPYIAAAALAGVIVVGAFTIGGRSLTGLTQLVNPAAATEAIESVVVSDYATARYAIWLIDQNYMLDREFKLHPFQSIWYTFAFPIPRALWDKPYPVSTYIADWADREGVKRGRGGVTSPVGTVGNAAAEGGTIAVIVYGLFFGALLRFFDHIIRRNPHQPLVILAIGSTMGQAFGIPRGETAVLTFNFLMGTAGSLVILTQMTKIIARYLPTTTNADTTYTPSTTPAGPALDTEDHTPEPFDDHSSNFGAGAALPRTIQHAEPDTPPAEAPPDSALTPNFGAGEATQHPAEERQKIDEHQHDPRLDWGAQP